MTYSSEPQYNIHSAVDREHCEEMERKYGWQLEDVIETEDPIIEVDCIFLGEQTSFEDERYGD